MDKHDMEKKFKAFDRVLIKDINGKWQIDFYSYWDKDSENHITMSYGGSLDITDEQILPYEGNEHLVGTTDSPDEEVKLLDTEKVMAYTHNENWIYATHINVLLVEGLFYVILTNGEDIKVKKVVKFSDFNPSNMEETRKHILCVKNGRIIRYKS